MIRDEELEVMESILVHPLAANDNLTSKLQVSIFNSLVDSKQTVLTQQNASVTTNITATDGEAEKLKSEVLN